RTDLAAHAADECGDRAERDCRDRNCDAGGGVSAGADAAEQRISALGCDWGCERISSGRYEAGDVSQSVQGVVGWRDGQRAGVCSVYGTGKVCGVCNQLRAPGLSGAVVLGVAVVYVSVPWRCVLRGRQPSVGAAGTRAVYV